MAKIYLSTTYSDLQGYRERVYRALRQLGHDVIAMEDYVATDQRPLQKCLEDVRRCNLYVGLFAWQYGYVPPGDNPDARSITELEFRAAREAGCECLLFLHDENAPWAPSQMDSGPDAGRIRSLRQELLRETTVSFFTDPNHLATQVTAAVALWEGRGREKISGDGRQADPADDRAMEILLDVFSTRRAFFKGDERFLHEAADIARVAEHLWNMLGFLDAGRAVVVAKSFAAVAGDLQGEFSQLRTIRNAALKQALSQLIVACKDYVERYGSRSYGLSLPRIGWRQRLEDFCTDAGKFGLDTTDSFEVYDRILTYIANSCGDLLAIRSLAQEAVQIIALERIDWADRCDRVREMIAEGSKQLVATIAILDRAASIVREVIGATDDAVARSERLRERSTSEGPVVARLLLAIAKVRSPKSWSVQTPATTLKSAELLESYHVHVGFADGVDGEIDLTEFFDFYYQSQPDLAADPDLFRSGRLEEGSNRLVWSKGINLSGELAREFLEKNR